MLLFETQALCKHYRAAARVLIRALDEVSLTIERGSLTVIQGASGSGKTTLLALLGALERPTKGRVLFDGNDLGKCSDIELARLRRRMGFIFQDFALIPSLSALENITYPLIPRGVPRRDRQRRARELLAHFGLESRLSTRARELSGGEQQRVAIARALAGQPEVILADEPTSNLDVPTADALLEVLRRMPLEGKTTVVASHDPRVLEMATSVYTLAAGRLNQASRGASAPG